MSERLLRRVIKRRDLRKKEIIKLLLSLGYYKKKDFEHYLENGDVNYDSVFQRVILGNKKEPLKHNIFYLIKKALDHQLSKDELAVVLFNLSKKRWFKSSKKVRPNESIDSKIKNEKENAKDKESGKVLEAIKALKREQKKIKEEYDVTTRTFTELIYFLNSSGSRDSYRNKSKSYINSILRDDIEDEAKLIFAKQREFYKELTEDFEKKYV